MEERFDLAPWELAPDSPEKLEGVASGRVKGDWLGKQDEEFLIRTARISSDIPVRFARPVDSAEEGNWVFFSRGYAGSAPQHYRGRKLFHISANAALGRLFHLSFEPSGVLGKGLVILDAKKQGHLRWLAPERGEDFLEDVLFAFDSRDLARAPTSQWRLRMEQQLREEGSGVHFALRWIEMNRKQQFDLLLPFKRGSYDELIQVMKWLLLLEPKLDTNSEKWLWEYDVFRRSHHLTDDLYPGLLPPFLRKWHKALLVWFGMEPQTQLVSQHPLTLQSSTYKANISISASPPTYHERLEAALELRDWARGKVPDELLQTLS